MIESLANANSKARLRVVEYSEADDLTFNRGDVLYFRNIGSQIDQCNALVSRALSVGSIVVDRYLAEQFNAYGRVIGPRSKMQCYNDMVELGIPTPTTRVITIDELATTDCVGVIKTSRGGRQGNGTYPLLSNNKQRIEAIIDDIAKKPRQGKDGLLLQEYIQNLGDIRVITIGGQVVAAMKRKPKDFNTLKFDVSSGKSKGLLSPRRDIISLAETASRQLGVDVASMDIVRSTNDGRLYIVDFNESPTARILFLRTNVNIPQLIVDFLNTL
jgi:glutathione synthase/RimK-type ligase-like ATP-grasp enzyme